MFFIWGSGSGRAVAGKSDGHLCPSCGAMGPSDLVVDYRYRHFWYLISFVTERVYSFVCGRCGKSTVAQPGEYRDKLGKDPIPFLRRRGWLVGLVVLAALVALGVYSSAESDKRIEAMLAAPQVGDVYSVDLAKVAETMSDHDRAYGDMRLAEIEGSKLKFLVAKSGWGRKRDLRSEERNTNIYSDDYYDLDDVVELDAAELKRLKSNGTLFDIHRKP